MMKDESSIRRRRSLGALLALLLMGGVFCVTRPPEAPEHPEGKHEGGGALSPECRSELRIQQQLARLAIDAMRTYGRIDPGLYDASPASEDRSLIRISKDAKPLPRDEQQRAAAELRTRPAPDLNEALRKLPEPETRAFLKAHEAALKACGSDCPPKVYDIAVKKLDLGAEAEAYAFEVKGTPPSLQEWERGFLQQYAHVAGDCGFSAPIQLDELERASLQTYSRGTVEARVRCDPKHPPADSCQACETAEGNVGGYKKRGPNQSCCYANCPP
jgi:hypothetical protein